MEASNIPAGSTTDERGYPNGNTTYPGYSPSTPCVDAGAVQSNYALSFTTEPPTSAFSGRPLSPGPVVTLTESGAAFASADSIVTMTDADGGLSLTGTNSVALSSGSASFGNLVFSAAETGDTLTASLSLNPNLSPASNLLSPSSTGLNVANGPPTITSVSGILPQQTQAITISGAGFGTQAACTGNSSYIELVDSTSTWFAGQPGNMVGLTISSWSDTQIVITDLPGAYGTNGWCISPGDQLYVKVWNAQTGNGPATYPIVASGGINNCTP